MTDTDALETLDAQLETITIEPHDDDVAELRIDRSRRMNAINEQMIEDLTKAVDAFALDPPSALVVTGSGRRAFSIGLDPDLIDKIFGDGNQGTYLRRVLGQALPEIMNTLDQMDAPVIGAVQGPAYGGGLELALATDLRIAGESTEISMPEVTHGFLPAAGGTQRLPAFVGEPRAKEIIFTGDTFEAETVAEWGLFNRVVSDEDVEDEAFELAAELAENPRNSYAGVKHAMRCHNNRRQTGMDLEFSYAVEQVDDVEFSEIK